MTEPDHEDTHSTSPRKKQSLWRPIVLAVILISFMVLAKVFNLGSRLGELREWILSLGTFGPLVYVLIYIVAVVFAIPGSVITVLGGVLFGSVVGVASVSVGSTIGASLAFLVSRHFARGAISQKFARNKKFHHLDQLTEEHGAIIVAITRLVPLFPFNLLNYGFGLTRVPFWTYVFWSWICMLPGTILYVVGADAVATAISERRIPWVMVIILVVIGVIITFLVRQARKKLKTDEGQPENE
ncbi:TVP38/TMEM64 family membrane protein [subsurface metagenome]|nr:hypothetical protein [bacterium]